MKGQARKLAAARRGAFQSGCRMRKIVESYHSQLWKLPAVARLVSVLGVVRLGAASAASLQDVMSWPRRVSRRGNCVASGEESFAKIVTRPLSSAGGLTCGWRRDPGVARPSPSNAPRRCHGAAASRPV